MKTLMNTVVLAMLGIVLVLGFLVVGTYNPTFERLETDTITFTDTQLNPTFTVTDRETLNADHTTTATDVYTEDATVNHNVDLEEYGSGGGGGTESFTVNDVLPSTTDLKVAWAGISDPYGGWYEFTIKTDSNNYNLFYTSWEDAKSILFLNLWSNQIIDGTGDYTSVCGDDGTTVCSSTNFIILDISGLTAAQRTVSTVDEDLSVTYEDLNAAADPTTYTITLSVTPNSVTSVVHESTTLTLNTDYTIDGADIIIDLEEVTLVDDETVTVNYVVDKSPVPTTYVFNLPHTPISITTFDVGPDIVNEYYSLTSAMYATDGTQITIDITEFELPAGNPEFEEGWTIYLEYTRAGNILTSHTFDLAQLPHSIVSTRMDRGELMGTASGTWGTVDYDELEVTFDADDIPYAGFGTEFEEDDEITFTYKYRTTPTQTPTYTLDYLPVEVLSSTVGGVAVAFTVDEDIVTLNSDSALTIIGGETLAVTYTVAYATVTTANHYHWNTTDFTMDLIYDGGAKFFDIRVFSLDDNNKRTSVLYDDPFFVSGSGTFTYEFAADFKGPYEVEFDGGTFWQGYTVPPPHASFSNPDGAIAIGDVVYNARSGTNLQHDPTDFDAPFFGQRNHVVVYFHLPVSPAPDVLNFYIYNTFEETILTDTVGILPINMEQAVLTFGDYTGFFILSTNGIMPPFIDYRVASDHNALYPFSSPLIHSMNIRQRGLYEYAVTDDDTIVYFGESIMTFASKGAMLSTSAKRATVKEFAQQSFTVQGGITEFFQIYDSALVFDTFTATNLGAEYNRFANRNTFEWTTSDDFNIGTGSVLFELENTNGWLWAGATDYQFESVTPYTVSPRTAFPDAFDSYLEASRLSGVGAVFFGVALITLTTLMLALLGAPPTLIAVTDFALVGVFSVLGIFPLWIIVMIGIVIFISIFFKFKGGGSE